jgi:hypothetical protein
MKKRHENALADILERVAYEGFATLDKWQLVRWYGQERFSVGIRRDIRERWEELVSELGMDKNKRLIIGENSVKGQILLMHSHIFWDGDEETI